MFYFILSLKLYTQLFDFILKIIFEFFFMKNFTDFIINFREFENPIMDRDVQPTIFVAETWNAVL